MIPKYIENWITVIEQMNNDNTYKLAWGRAIVECVSMNEFKIEDGKVVVEFDSISEKMLKYYWNQIFFFKLKQSPYKDKDPLICRYTQKLIDVYINIVNSSIPIWFNRAYEGILKSQKDDYEYIIKQISKTLHENVCWRFKRVQSEFLDIYEYAKSLGSRIYFNIEDAKLLGEYAIIISKLFNYKWAQLLEQFNYAPKIASKVNGISEAKLRRNNLSSYREQLLKENNGKAIDFYTGKELNDGDITIDHVIPWSFMYSDDIWNLVITSKSNNSSKLNSIPKPEIIERLKNRNKELLNILEGKMHSELELAIKNGYVDKFFYECRM